MPLRSFSIILFLVSFFAGCSLIPEYQPLMNLKNLGDERARTGEGLKKEEGLYNKLKDDLKGGRLKKGKPKKEILAEYGRPVFARAVDDGSGIKLCLVYRHPTEFFSSDMVYLYFDAKEKLIFLEIKPAPFTEENKAPAQDTAR